MRHVPHTHVEKYQNYPEDLIYIILCLMFVSIMYQTLYNGF